MKVQLTLVALFAVSIGMVASKPKVLTVTVANPLDEPRAEEIVELPAPKENVIVHDVQGNLLPSQRTYDGKLIFPATVPAKGSATYTLTPVQVPYTYDTFVCGRVYPERVDDVAWENDRVAFRAYGPALQKSGERAFGYDIWCKRATKHPVVEKRYFDELRRGITYHRDHGNGLDCYKVGPTLGAGTPALLPEGKILYPWAYDTCTILDNGPLRFTIRLTYPAKTVAGMANVIEERLVSLDLNSHFNRSTVTYKGLPNSTPMAVGIVRHIGSSESFTSSDMLLCDDPTERPKDKAETGILFVGALFPTPVKETRTLPLDEKARKATAAEGHLLGVTSAQASQPFTYYWGAGWSRGDIPTWADWKTCAETTLRRLRAPLTISVK